MANLEKTSREIHKVLRATWRCYDVDTEHCDKAGVGDAVRQRALCIDLTIVGPALLNEASLGPLVINGSLFDTGKPVLVVPEGAEATLSPRRVLVGWDSRVEASRSVREALDLLSGAEEVRVAVVDPEATCTGNGAEPGADIAAYLTRHGARVSVDRLASAGKSATTVLAQHAIDTSADMIVMGAYGNRRLRERLFGSVTRWIVGKPPFAAVFGPLTGSEVAPMLSKLSSAGHLIPSRREVAAKAQVSRCSRALASAVGRQVEKESRFSAHAAFGP
ncbi:MULTISPECIES: universal stress protein [unclassified Mesorhizobium]|uniref:universal stress protein n=1 Tax=unclassified Mesorhizobium TaxID=325217 RepID=UPI00333CB3A5